MPVEFLSACSSHTDAFSCCGSKLSMFKLLLQQIGETSFKKWQKKSPEVSNVKQSTCYHQPLKKIPSPLRPEMLKKNITESGMESNLWCCCFARCRHRRFIKLELRSITSGTDVSFYSTSAVGAVCDNAGETWRCPISGIFGGRTCSELAVMPLPSSCSEQAWRRQGRRLADIDEMSQNRGNARHCFY